MKSKTKIITILIALVVLAGVGSAALLGYYSEIVGSANVEQSIVVEGNNWDIPVEYVIGCSAGSYTSGPFRVENRANIAAYIEFETLITDSTGIGGPSGVTTTYWSKLKLDNKDTITWQPIDDSIEGELTYRLDSDAFNYEFEAIGLNPEAEYCLIYYADKQDRFVNWGGNNPGALIGTGASDTSGKLVISGSTALSMDLPDCVIPDWNCNPGPDYCNGNNGFDNYDMCCGAKVWLVPCGDYNEVEKNVNWANYGSYLYETDMINYDDTNDGIEGLRVCWNSEFDLYIVNDFDTNIAPGDYIVKTTVKPVL